MIDRLDFKRWRKDQAEHMPSMELADMLGEHTPAFEITNVADLCNRMELFSIRDHNIVLEPERFPNVAPPFRSYWCEWRCPAMFDKDKTIGRFGVWCVITDRTDDEHWNVMCGLFVNDRKPKCIGRFVLEITRGGHVTDPGRLVVFPEGVDYVLARERREVGDNTTNEYVRSIEEAASEMNDQDRERFLYSELERLEANRDDAHKRVLEINMELANIVGDSLRIGVLPPLLLAHSLLGCKNVDTEDHRPDAKLSRAAVKRRGQALTMFKTLVIRPMGGKHAESQRVSIGSGQSALHLVRGHFKTFTQERPLFGSRVGTYWWSPNVRGSAEHGTIVKDYEVRV